MEPIRLLMVLPPSSGEGLEHTSLALLRGLDRAVVTPVLALTHSRAANPRLIDRLPPDVELLEIDKRGFLDQPRAIRRLRSLYADLRPDVVIGRATYAAILALLARRGARHRPAIIATEHATPEMLRARRASWLLWAGRHLYPRAEAVVTSSIGLGGAVAQAFRLPTGTVRPIHNAFQREVDDGLSTGRPSEPPFDGRQRVIAYVGRLSPEKGVADLIAAVSLLDRSIDVHLLLIGDGPQRDELGAVVERLGLADQVTFAGYIAQPFAHMKAADVLAAPSHTEAFGMSIAEGLRSGAAIVAADCDWGPREQIEHERSGLLVPVGQPRALADAIERVLTDHALAARLRHGARERSEHFTPDRMLRAYEQLIVEVAGRKG